MDHNTLFFFIIILGTVVVPLWLILHYATKWRSSRGLSADDMKMLEDLWVSADRMESRLKTLETILDTDHSGRSSHGQG